MQTTPKFAAIILAAGHSSRMGEPKWRLTMPSGKNFLHHIAGNYNRMGIPAIAVININDQELFQETPSPEPLTLAVNPTPQLGRMFSLQCGLQKLPDPVPCFVHNIDNPSVNKALTQKLMRQLGSFSYARPICNGKGAHPLLINTDLTERLLQLSPPLPILRDYIKNFKGVDVSWNDPEILLNINTRQDYESFLQGKVESG